MIPWPARYPAYAPLVHAARDRSELWRLALGVILIATGYIALAQFYLGFVDQMVPLSEVDSGQSPGSLLALLLSFLCLTAPVLATVIVLHGRSLWSLVGPPGRLWHHIRLTLLVVVALHALLTLLPPWNAYGPLDPGLPFGEWLLLLPLALVAIAIQTSAEELLFRGYLQQQLAARFASPWIWMALPSALFGVLHYMPSQAGENAPLIALWAGLFGLLMADITARTGSLGPALVLHFVNNALAMLYVAVPDSLSGFALYHLPFDMDDAAQLAPWLWVDFVLMIVTWLAVRLAFRR